MHRGFPGSTVRANQWWLVSREATTTSVSHRGGCRVAVGVADRTLRRDIWLVDTARGARTRLTFDAADENAAIWSPDGSRIVFNSDRKGQFDLSEKRSNLAGTETVLLEDDSQKFPVSWSPDGRYVLYQSGSRDDSESVHLWVLPLTGDRKPFRLLDREDIDGHGQFSPDGDWIAYASEPSVRSTARSSTDGRPEVYVTGFPGARGKWQISAAGGTHPRWRADGQEIYYLGLDARVVAVSLSVRGGALDVGQARPLFGLLFPPLPGPAVGRVGRQPLYSYEPARDGQRFLVRTILEETAPITLLANWQALLPHAR